MKNSPDQPNFAFLYDKEYFSDKTNLNHFIDKKLAYRVIHDCFVLPYSRINEGGLFDNEGNYIKGSSFREGGGWLELEGEDNSTSSLSALASLQNLRISDAVHEKYTIVYIGILMKTWGHFITDSMRLLWFLHSKDYTENFKDCKLAYMPGHDFKLSGSHKSLLEILGVDTQKLIPVTKLTKYDAVVIPDESFFMSSECKRFFTSEYTRTIDIVRNYAAKLAPSSSDKIYFSYARYANYKTIGEDKLEKYFASKGYEIIYPETLSLDEQLRKIIGCKSFASTIGSCSHNMIFLKDNTEVILIPRANSITGYHLAIDQVHKLNITYVDSSFSVFAQSQWGGPFLFCISSLIRRYFHDDATTSIISASDFNKYMRVASGWKFNRSFGAISQQKDNVDIYRYYNNFAAEFFSGLHEAKFPFKLRKMLRGILRKLKP